MPKYSAKSDGQIYYEGNTRYDNSVPWGDSALTNPSGIATWYLTTDKTAAGNALFSNILLSSIIITPWSSTDRVYIAYTPVISADKKSITCQIKQNASLLSLGLLPFAVAPANVMVTLSCRGLL